MNNDGYCVYMHVVPKEISGYVFDKRYIGITSRKPEDRWGKDGENYQRQIFWNAIQKYGWNNIQHIILYEGLSKEDASRKEVELIEKYETRLGEKGYNASKGGETEGRFGQNAYHPVYCVELNRAFKNAKIASDITGENVNTIRNRVYENKNGNLKVGSHWCDIDHIYKYFKGACYNKPFVYLKNSKVYTNRGFINREFGLKLTHRSLITLEDYIKFIGKGKDVSNRIMYLEDYLKLYDYTM